MLHSAEPVVTPLFDGYAPYYDALYADKDYLAEAEYVAGLVRRHVPQARSLLEFGSGTGHHGRLLAAQGYDVEGVERSAAMLALQGPAAGFRCRLGDARHIRCGRRFDAVLALFHVINYQRDDDDVHALMANAARHLEPGGIFLFDTWYTPAVLAQPPEPRVKHARCGRERLQRTAQPRVHADGRRVDVVYTLEVTDEATAQTHTIHETHPMRHFGLDELDHFAAAHGFQRLSAHEFLSGRPAGDDTWGVCVVMRKA